MKSSRSLSRGVGNMGEETIELYDRVPTPGLWVVRVAVGGVGVHQTDGFRLANRKLCEVGVSEGVLNTG